MVPQQDERLRIVGDVSQVNDDPRVQKALRRLATEKVPSSVSQLVMWRLTSGHGLERPSPRWPEWANPYELTLARDFVEHLDELQEKDGETGSLLFQVEGTDEAGTAMATELTEAPQGQDGARAAGEDRHPGAAGRPVGGLPGPAARRRGAGAGGQQRRPGAELGRLRQVLAEDQGRQGEVRRRAVRRRRGRGHHQPPGPGPDDPAARSARRAS